MSRRLISTFGLIGFFLMWGVFGFAAGAPRGEPPVLATVPPAQNTPVVAAATNAAGIPVTGRSQPVFTEVVVFYGLIGLTASFLVLALLHMVNRSASSYVQPGGPSPKHRDEN